MINKRHVSFHSVTCWAGQPGPCRWCPPPRPWCWPRPGLPPCWPGCRCTGTAEWECCGEGTVGPGIRETMKRERAVWRCASNALHTFSLEMTHQHFRARWPKSWSANHRMPGEWESSISFIYLTWIAGRNQFLFQYYFFSLDPQWLKHVAQCVQSLRRMWHIRYWNGPARLLLYTYGTEMCLHTNCCIYGTEMVLHTNCCIYGTEMCLHANCCIYGTEMVLHTYCCIYGTEMCLHTYWCIYGTKMCLHAYWAMQVLRKLNWTLNWLLYHHYSNPMNS